MQPDGDLEQLLPAGKLLPFSAPSSQRERPGAPTGSRFEKDVGRVVDRETADLIAL